MQKILYSPGFGAGWSSWAHGSPVFQKFMLTYPLLIAAVERGEKITGDHPALLQFLKDAASQFGEEPYTGGADQLQVKEVSGPFRIDEYDGSERVIESISQEWIIL